MYPTRIPMAAALLPSGSAQSSQPRMTDHRLARRLIPLARRWPSSHPPGIVRALGPARQWASTATRCGEIVHHLPPPAVACTRRYAGVVVDALSFFPPGRVGLSIMSRHGTIAYSRRVVWSGLWLAAIARRPSTPPPVQRRAARNGRTAAVPWTALAASWSHSSVALLPGRCGGR